MDASERQQLQYIDEMEAGKTLPEYLAMLRRRKFALLLPAVAVFAIALLLAFGLPASYQSKATILIEEQEIPQDFVRSTITSFAAQQVQVISQRVLTVETINGIAEKFGLYQDPDSNRRLPRTELAKLFREDMTLDLVSAEVIDPRSGRPTEATIAFTLAFEASSPSMAQKVTNELVTLFLNENLRERTDQAASTARFLDEEAGRLDEELVVLEEELARFKAANEGSLPELYQFNLSTLERTQRELSDVRLRLQELEKRKIELGAEMAQLSPQAPVVLPSGDVVLSDLDRLRALESELRRKRAIYRETHPDITRLQREVDTLRDELGVGLSPSTLREQLREQRGRLAELRSRYNDNHAEVVTTRRVIGELEASLAQAERGPSQPEPVADNPAYVLLQTQLNATKSDIRSLTAKEQELTDKLARYEARIQRAPDVEKDYQALLRDYENATAKYQEIRAKQREAAVARNLEQEQKGERFVLVEPPVLPADPVSPNRPAIIFLGFVLAGGVGVGMALVREAMDGALHGATELARAMGGQSPLVTVPYIDTATDVARQRRLLVAAGGAAVLAGVLFLVYLHLFFRPLDVLFFVVLNKLGL